MSCLDAFCLAEELDHSGRGTLAGAFALSGRLSENISVSAFQPTNRVEFLEQPQSRQNRRRADQKLKAAVAPTPVTVPLLAPRNAPEPLSPVS